MIPTPTLAPVREAFRAIATTVVPAASELGEEAWTRAEAAIEEGLQLRPPSVRGQIRLFIRIVNGLAFVRHGRTLASLSHERRAALLSALERSRVLLLRRGVWGVRTLAYMGYYALPHVQEALGYRAAPEGWSTRGGDAGPWPERDGGGPEPAVADLLTPRGPDA